MNRDEQFNRNVDLHTAFMRYAAAHPEILEEIPARAQLIFLPEDDPELCQANMALGEKAAREKEQPVVLVWMPTPDLFRPDMPAPLVEVVRPA